MKIVFVRHAEKNKGEGDLGLTKKGVKQAKYLAKRLRKESFDEFYCSDMNRAKQTAKIVSRAIKINPKIQPELDEFSLKFLKNSKDKWTKQEKNKYAPLIKFLKSITKKKNNKNSILIIAHGITNRIILSYLSEMGIGSLAKVIRFTQSNTGVNVMHWNNEFKNWRLDKWNDTSHLPLRLTHKEN